MPAKVVIVSRTKNRPLLLQRCLLSVLNQTYTDWLHIIVNDGGDPATVEGVVSRFAARYGPRIRIIHNETSVGMQNASNLAIRATASEYLAIHDDDDTWNPAFLEECVHYLDSIGPQSTEQGVVVQTHWIMEEIDSGGTIQEISRRDFMPCESISLFELAAKNLFPPIALLYRRSVHDVIGYFDQTFNELGDHDFNLRFLSRYEMGVIQRKLAGYHWRHQANGSSYANTVVEGLPAHRKMLVKMQNHYLRQDLKNQQMGLGFLVNMASGFNTQIGWLHGLSSKTDNVADRFSKVIRKLTYYERLMDGFLSPWKSGALPRRIYDHLADWVILLSGPKPNSAQPAKLPAGMRSARVISLDVFDTTLLRLVRKPADLFLYMQSDVRRLLNRPGLGFVEVRIAAEEESREEMRRVRQTGETTLEDIYLVLRKRLGCDEETAKQIKKWELQAENRLCYPHPEMNRVAAWAAGNGRKLVFASDMYLPTGEVTGLLERNGFKDARLFLSSELSLSKHEGGLFDHILATLQCSPNEVLHIGDNAHSDVEQARRKGMAAHHWTRPQSQTPLVDQQISCSGAWDGDLASSLYTGLVRRRRLNHPVEQTAGPEFWQMIGYEVMGPLHHAFVSWVRARAVKLGIKKLFFLARDGFHLVKAFELFPQAPGVKLESQYLFASRRLWNVARMERLDEENLAFLVTPNPGMRVRDFLERIGISLAAHESLVRQLGFQNLEERVTTKNGVFISEEQHQNMRRLVRKFEQQILELAAQERGKLLAYFKDTGLFEEGVGIVDIGWQASSLKSLHQLLSLAGRAQKIRGFYFGTWHSAQPVSDAGCLFESFFMHLNQPPYRARILEEGVELVESLFSAPHPTITGIERLNGEWEPSYGEPEVNARARAEIEIAAGTAMEFIRDAVALWPAGQEISPAYGYQETVLERLLRYPKKEEAIAFGKVSWRNTFGGSGPLRHLAKPPAAWGRIARRRALQDAYDHCYWKQGFLAQLSSRAKKYIKT